MSENHTKTLTSFRTLQRVRAVKITDGACTASTCGAKVKGTSLVSSPLVSCSPGSGLPCFPFPGPATVTLDEFSLKWSKNTYICKSFDLMDFECYVMVLIYQSVKALTYQGD